MRRWDELRRIISSSHRLVIPLFFVLFVPGGRGVRTYLRGLLFPLLFPRPIAGRRRTLRPPAACRDGDPLPRAGYRPGWALLAGKCRRTASMMPVGKRTIAGAASPPCSLFPVPLFPPRGSYSLFTVPSSLLFTLRLLSLPIENWREEERTGNKERGTGNKDSHITSSSRRRNA